MKEHDFYAFIAEGFGSAGRPNHNLAGSGWWSTGKRIRRKLMTPPSDTIPRQPRGTKSVIALVRCAIACATEGLIQRGKPCRPRVASTTRSGFCFSI